MNRSSSSENIADTHGGAFELPEQSPGWEIHKFGGASLATADLYKTCAQVLISESKCKSASGQPWGAVPTAAVVSAASGVTDELIGVVKAAANQSVEAAEALLEKCVTRVIGILGGLGIKEAELNRVRSNVEKDRASISSVLRAIRLMKSVPSTALELVTGLGEVWSAQTLCAHLNAVGVVSDWIDCREMLYLQSPEGGTGGLGEKGGAIAFISPAWPMTVKAAGSWWLDVQLQHGWMSESGAPLDGSKFAPVIVVTGFVASTEEGVPTTLKRSGSDYSATIFAKLMRAGKITLWKNVDGIYTADPRRVPDAFPIRTMLYEEAMELAYFGAQVLHPSAMAPCIERRIPVHVRNIFNTAHPGTIIQGSAYDKPTQDGPAPGPGRHHTGRKGKHLEEAAFDKDKLPVKGITSVDQVALVNLEGATLIGVPGVASRMFGALQSREISVLMITQASSEHSICCAVSASEAQRAAQAVREGFELELSRHQVAQVQVVEGLSALAVIGQGMSSSVGAAGRMFRSLSSAHVNIVAIAQGSSERNITVIIRREDLSRAMRAIHSAFTLSAVPVSVGVLGAAGRVGSELVRQIKLQRNRLLTEENLDLRVRLLADKDGYLFAEEALDLDHLCPGDGDDGLGPRPPSSSAEEPCAAWLAQAKKYSPEAAAAGLTGAGGIGDELGGMLAAAHYPHSIIIDCTASDEVVGCYESWLNKGLHIVSANNRCPAGPKARFESVMETARRKNRCWAFEVTVGGPAPVLNSIQDLVETGDNVQVVQGLLSSTLNHILCRVSPRTAQHTDKMTFSEATAHAISRGYADRRFVDDLNGVDAARKCVILARVLGMDMEFEQVERETIISKEKLASLEALGDKVSTDDLKFLDAEVAARCAEAAAEGCVLRCVSVVDVVAGTASVKIRKVHQDDSDRLFPLVSSSRGHSVAISIETDRYKDEPLIVHGPGAGAKLCASGVFADLLRVAKRFALE